MCQLSEGGQVRTVRALLGAAAVCVAAAGTAAGGLWVAGGVRGEILRRRGVVLRLVHIAAAHYTIVVRAVIIIRATSVLTFSPPPVTPASALV